MTRSTLCLLTLAACAAAYSPGPNSAAQTTTTVTVTPASKDTKDKYAAEPSVVERMDLVYTYNADGTGTRQLTSVVDLHTGAAVKEAGILNISFASASEHVVFNYIRVRHPNGTITETPASDAQEQPASVTREAPFYSDLKEAQVPVRGLQPGDVLEYDVKIVRTRAEAPNHFWGDGNLTTPASQSVVLEESIEVRVPKGTYIQTWSPKHQPVVSDTDTQHIIRWNNSQLKPVAGKKETELIREDPEALDVDRFDDRLPSVAWSNFHSWAEVGAWYRSMEGARIEPDDEVRDKVKQLTEGKTTDEDKARAIYGYVGPQIRYVGVAFGIGRYQPHEAADVLHNQYGDCKDKHTLQAAMLAAAGIPSDAALIGQNVAFTDALPSPGWFNHVITLAHINGKPVWLDATAEVAPWQMLNVFLRGKTALVIPATGDAHLETTPTTPPFPFLEKFEAVGTLDDKGTSHSHITMDLRSDGELIFREAVRSVSPAQYDQLMQRISQSMGYVGKVTDANFGPPNDTSKPFHVAYEYEREKNGDWDSLRILAQLPPVGLADADEKDPPVFPIQLGAPHVEIAHAEMKLPTGWGVELPTPVHAKSAFATLDKTYKFEKGTLITDRRIEILAAQVPAAQWRDYHKFYKDAALESEPFIQLIRTGGKARPAAAYNEDAAQQVEDARQLIQQQHWTEAQQTLDAAKTINSSQEGLWLEYAIMAMEYGKRTESVDDLKREIANHPEENYPYVLLASIQQSQNKLDDAIATLHKLLSQQPDDEQGNRLLAGILMDRSDYNGAETALRTALQAADPEHPNEQINLQLANVLLKDNKRDEAKTIFTTLATNSNDTGILNDAAYSLADESLDIPLAETAARHSLNLIEEAVNANAGSDSDQFQRASLQIATWDTLGWVFFRESKFTEAEPWLRGAWHNGQQDDVGYHLGMDMEKLGKSAESLKIYHLAFEANRSSGSHELNERIADRIEALNKSSVTVESPDEHDALQTQRTFKVPAASGIGKLWGTISFTVTPTGLMQQIRVDSHDAGDHTALDRAASSLNGHKLDLDIPAASKAPLLRQGVLTCAGQTTCELILVPPNSINRSSE